MVIVYVCSSPFSFDTIVTDVHVLFTTCSCLPQANHSLSQVPIELFSNVLTGINSVFSSTLTTALLRRSVQVKERDQVPARLQMLDAWLKGTVNASWRQLADALKDMGDLRSSQAVEKYC